MRVAAGKLASLALLSSLVCFISIFQLASAASSWELHDMPCPEGWNHHVEDDTCNSVFPRQNHNTTVGVKVSFDDAFEFCRLEHAEIPLIYNWSKLEYYNDLAGRTSGRAWWIGVRADRSKKDLPQRWQTRQLREEGFSFDWDQRQKQPGVQSCVVQYMHGDGKKIHGGRTKMVTRDCWERHSVICTKPRVPPHLTAIVERPHQPLLRAVGGARRVEAIWGHDNHYEFWGQNIPRGTMMTLQTTTEEEFVSGPNQPTDCKHVGVLHGASTPFPLNVTTRTHYDQLCNGTCQMATVSIPSDWPLIRGAKYSFCFFIPRPWPTPMVNTEYDYELLGPEAYLEVVQKHEEFLRDICLRREHNLEMFYGSGHVDTHRGVASPFFFNSAVEQGRR